MGDEPKTPLGKKLLAIRNKAIANGMQLKTRGEIMNEAPTPEMVEKSLSDVACGIADYSDCEVLRAHIAALSKTIKCQQGGHSVSTLSQKPILRAGEIGLLNLKREKRK